MKNTFIMLHYLHILINVNKYLIKAWLPVVLCLWKNHYMGNQEPKQKQNPFNI